MPLAWNEINTNQDGKCRQYFVYVEDLAKIHVMELNDEEVKVRELFLPAGIKVKCLALHDNEQNNNKLSQNLAQDFHSKGLEISENDIKVSIPPREPDYHQINSPHQYPWLVINTVDAGVVYFDYEKRMA